MTTQQTTPKELTPIAQALFNEFGAETAGVSHAEHDRLAEALGVDDQQLIEISRNGLWSHLAEKKSIDICRSAWELARFEGGNGRVKKGEALAEVICSLLEVGENDTAQERFKELSSLACMGLVVSNPVEA